MGKKPLGSKTSSNSLKARSFVGPSYPFFWNPCLVVSEAHDDATPMCVAG